MAGIDKTYLDTYDELVEVIKWCKSIGTVTDKYGNTFNPLDFVYEEPDLKESEFKPGMVLWNTPTYFDLFLIRSCPIKFIQERLKKQYSKDFIQSVKENRSSYDTFERNGLGKNLKVTVQKKPSYKRCNKKTWWWISIEDSNWWYNEDNNEWVHYLEGKEHTTNVCTKYRGKLTMRKIMRILRKWNLPAGLTLKLVGDYDGQEFIIKTK